MPTKKKTELRKLPKIPAELLEQFADGIMTADAIEDASAAFKKALIERALSANWAACGCKSPVLTLVSHQENRVAY